MKDLQIKRLGPEDVAVMRALNRLFARCFEDRDTYQGHPADDGYLEQALAKESVIVLVALVGQEVIGGLVAYVLPKLEQARSEVYIYDLATDAGFRRQGVATGLIQEQSRIARDIGAWVSFVQADYDDPPAIKLYEKLGTREEVLHFDIAPAAKTSRAGHDA